MGRVFTKGPRDLGSIPGRVIPKTLKLYVIPPRLTLSNIRYVSRIKWSNPGKRVPPSPTPRCSSYWKGAFWSHSTTVANFTLLPLWVRMVLKIMVEEYSTLPRSQNLEPHHLIEFSVIPRPPFWRYSLFTGNKGNIYIYIYIFSFQILM